MSKVTSSNSAGVLGALKSAFRSPAMYLGWGVCCKASCRALMMAPLPSGGM